jgi:hypothetical protein
MYVRKAVAMRRLLVATVVAALAMSVFAGTAFSDNCFNLSRTSAGLSTNPADFTSPYTKGRWVWLPSVGAPIPAWGFEVPANYQHGNVNAWLLSNTKYCEEGGFLFYNGRRTTEHGVQSGCGAFG